MPTGQGLGMLFELIGAEQLGPKRLFASDFPWRIRRANPKPRDPPLQDVKPIAQNLPLVRAARFRPDSVACAGVDVSRNSTKT